MIRMISEGSRDTEKVACYNSYYLIYFKIERSSFKIVMIFHMHTYFWMAVQIGKMCLIENYILNDSWKHW